MITEGAMVLLSAIVLSTGRRTEPRPCVTIAPDSTNEVPYRPTVPRVLLVEDDAAIAEPLSRALRRDGYDVEVVGSGAQALARWEAGGSDLVILDLGLPDVDGLEVCRRIRAADRHVPVLVLTARADELDVVIGLDSGADDYVTKPFRLAELLARVRGRAPRRRPRRRDARAGRPRRPRGPPGVAGRAASST